MESSPLPLALLAAVLFFGEAIDTFYIVGFGFYQKWARFQELANFFLNPTTFFNVTKAATALFGLLQLTRYIIGIRRGSSPSDGFPVRPMFFPCRTSHVRMFPIKHGFGYSYLLTGVPVGWRGSIGGMISEDDGKKQAPWYMRLLSFDPGRAWYTINGDDYLARGHVDGGLRGKLKQYLEGQGIDPDRYAHAYLVTAARFLGYASNPLSVWYLYSSSRELTALILEVNNTFDERRIYFLEPKCTPKPLAPNSDKFSKPRYLGNWTKDFYVSVFNARAGSYSLAAYDPFYPHLSSPGTIDSTVTLSSPEGKAKLIARIYSIDHAVDPAAMKMWQKTGFLARWWWVGLATFPRTIQQAVIILFRKKLPWVFRPEPKGSTIARHADETEVFIEILFRRYLRDMVENSQENLKVRYIPAGLLDVSPEVIMSSSAQLAEEKIEEVEIRVLTPIFYSRAIRYRDILDGILSECHESSTISLSNIDVLMKFEWGRRTIPCIRPGLRERYSYALLVKLRRRPAPIVCLDEPKAGPSQRPFMPKESLRNLDAFVLQHSCFAERKEYWARLWKLFITERIAFGWAEIFDLEMFIVKIVVLWNIAKLVF